MFFTKAKPNVRNEYARYKSQSQKILELLQQRNITTPELMKIAANYTMRISDLRKQGHKIVAIYEKPGVWVYVYKGKKR